MLATGSGDWHARICELSVMSCRQWLMTICRELHHYCMSSFFSYAYKYVDFRSMVKASAAERSLSLLPIALSLLPYAHSMDSARVAIPILYICWNVFSVNLFSFVLLVDSSNLLCDV